MENVKTDEYRIQKPHYVTIRQAHKLGLASIYSLRQMLKRGELPGYYAGTRYYINLDALVDKLGGYLYVKLDKEER